jgi:hypothetical protein
LKFGDKPINWAMKKYNPFSFDCRVAELARSTMELSPAFALQIEQAIAVKDLSMQKELK